MPEQTSTIPLHAPYVLSALSLSSVEDTKVEIPAGIWFDEDFSIDLWVNPNSPSVQSALLEFENAGNKDRVVLSFPVDENFDPPANYIEMVPELLVTRGTETKKLKADIQGLELGAWTHLAATLKGTTARIYVNGRLAGYDHDFVRPEAVQRQKNHLGYSDAHRDYFNGTMSDLRIWKGALSAEQVLLFMNWSSKRKTALKGPYHKKTTAELLGNWRMDAGYGDVVFNSCDPKRLTDGKLNSKATSRWEISSRPTPLFGNAPIARTALAFEEKNNNFVQVDPVHWFDGGFTIEGRVFIRAHGNWTRLIDFGDGPRNDNVVFALTSGITKKPTLEIFKGNKAKAITSPDALPTEQWVYVAATLDANSGHAVLYINGKPVTSGTLQAPPRKERKLNYIGKSNGKSNNYFDGVMSMLRIWDGPLDEKNLNEVMVKNYPGQAEVDGKKLLANWNFDEGAGDILFNKASQKTDGQGRLLSEHRLKVLPQWVPEWTLQYP